MKHKVSITSESVCFFTSSLQQSCRARGNIYQSGYAVLLVQRGFERVTRSNDPLEKWEDIMCETYGRANDGVYGQPQLRYVALVYNVYI